MSRLVTEYERGLISAEEFAAQAVRIFRNDAPLLIQTQKKWMLTPGWEKRHIDMVSRFDRVRLRYADWHEGYQPEQIEGNLDQLVENPSIAQPLSLLWDRVGYSFDMLGPSAPAATPNPVKDGYRIVSAKTSRFPTEKDYNDYFYGMVPKMESLMEEIEEMPVAPTFEETSV